MIKSNSLFINIQISEKDKEFFRDIILEERKRYQILYNYIFKYIRKVQKEENLIILVIGFLRNSRIIILVSNFLKSSKSRIKLIKKNKVLKEK